MYVLGKISANRRVTHCRASAPSRQMSVRVLTSRLVPVIFCTLAVMILAHWLAKPITVLAPTRNAPRHVMASTSSVDSYVKNMRDLLGLDDGQVIRLHQMIEAAQRDVRTASDAFGRRVVARRFYVDDVPSILRADQVSAYETYLQRRGMGSH